MGRRTRAPGCPDQGVWLLTITPRGQPSGQSPRKDGKSKGRELKSEQGRVQEEEGRWRGRGKKEKVLLRFGVVFTTNNQKNCAPNSSPDGDLFTTLSKQTEVWRPWDHGKQQ